MCYRWAIFFLNGQKWKWADKGRLCDLFNQSFLLAIDNTFFSFFHSFQLKASKQKKEHRTDIGLN